MNPLNLLQQNLNNPIIQNAMNLMNRGDNKGLEELARNICKERGLNADELYRQLNGQRKT